MWSQYHHKKVEGHFRITQTSRLAPYNLRMANQTILKPIGLILDLRILIHGIPYINVPFYGYAK
jgi:hypothetical protein